MENTNQAKSCRHRWRLIFGLAVWFGLIAGFAEVLFQMRMKYLPHKWYRRFNQDFVWMMPLTDVVIFLIPAVVLVSIGLIFRKRNILPAALIVFAGLFFAKLLLLYGKLHYIALWLLVLGLTVQTYRLLRKRVLNLERIVWKTLVPLVVLEITLIAVTVGYRAYRTEQTIAALPPARDNAPNVLVITLDTVRAANLSLHGYHRQTTPHLERWAKKGAWFRHAIAPAPWTLPSHASMFTGRYPHELSTTWCTPLDTTHPTLAEAMRDNGYLTAGFSANKAYVTHETGLNRGFIHFADFGYSFTEFLHYSKLSRSFIYRSEVRDCLCNYAPYNRKTAEDVNRDFLSWLGSAGERPFFAFLNYCDAHDPYLPPPPYDSKFGPPPTVEEKVRFRDWWAGPPRNYSKSIIDAAIRSYDSAIAYLDDQLDTLFKELDRRGRLKNTLIIITSDHGEHFGEHGLYIHGHSLYRPLLHVPLIVLYPGYVPEKTVVDEFVTLCDLPATVLELTQSKAGAEIPGHSWSRCWLESTQNEKKSGSPLFQVVLRIPPGFVQPDEGNSPVAAGDMVSLFKGSKYYIKNVGTGAEELYDFERDPLEEKNLAALEEYEPQLKEFREELEQFYQKRKSRWVDFPE